MSNVVGSGIARTLVDSDGDALDDGEGRLNVNATIGIGSSTFTSYPQFAAATSPTTLTSSLSITVVTDCKQIMIQADSDNTGYIMVGDGGAAADTEGIRITAGDLLVLPVSSTNNVSLDASAVSQNVNITLIR